MRKLTTLMYFFMAAALFLTSCGGDDENPEPEVTTPTFDFTASSEVKNGETISVTPNETVTIIVTGSKVDRNLKQVSFYEGENLITVTGVGEGRLTINGEVQDENPVDISNDDNENFTWTIQLKAASTEGSTNYKIVLEDNDELKTPLSFTIVTTSSDMNSGVKLYSSKATADAAATTGSFYAVMSNATGTSTAFVNTSTEAKVDFAFAGGGVTSEPYTLAQPGNVTVKPNFTKTTLFASSSLNFSTATKSQIESESPSSASVAIAAGNVYSFYNSTTKTKGLVQIVSIDATDLITFNVKFIEVTPAVVLVEAK